MLYKNGEKIKKDPTNSSMNVIKVFIQEVLALDFIGKDLTEFLLIEFPRVPVFYLLSKICKPDFPPKGRLIMSAQGSLLEKNSKYLDYLLQPHVSKIKTYIKDTSDFIKKVEGLKIPIQAVILHLIFPPPILASPMWMCKLWCNITLSFMVMI